MAKISCSGVYTESNLELVHAFSSKKRAEEYVKYEKEPCFIKHYHHIYPSQVEALTYDQAVQLEVLMDTAKRWRQMVDKNSK